MIKAIIDIYIAMVRYMKNCRALSFHALTPIPHPCPFLSHHPHHLSTARSSFNFSGSSMGLVLVEQEPGVAWD